MWWIWMLGCWGVWFCCCWRGILFKGGWIVLVVLVLWLRVEGRSLWGSGGGSLRREGCLCWVGMRIGRRGWVLWMWLWGWKMRRGCKGWLSGLGRVVRRLFFNCFFWGFFGFVLSRWFLLLVSWCCGLELDWFFVWYERSNDFSGWFVNF